MMPPMTVHAVPIAVIVFGWTPRRTSQFATGSMTRKYPVLTQSGRIFIRLREAERHVPKASDAAPRWHGHGRGWRAARVTHGDETAGAALRHVKVSFSENWGNQSSSARAVTARETDTFR